MICVVAQPIGVSNPSHPSHVAPEEVAAGNRIMCGSIILNGDPGALQRRIANALYDGCRAGSQVIANFPEFDHVVKALRDNGMADSTASYKVCVAKADKLFVLQSLARRWIEYEGTKDDASTLIRDHNRCFNPDSEADYMENDERSASCKTLKTCSWDETKVLSS